MKKKKKTIFTICNNIYIKPSLVFGSDGNKIRDGHREHIKYILYCKFTVIQKPENNLILWIPSRWCKGGWR